MKHQNPNNQTCPNCEEGQIDPNILKCESCNYVAMLPKGKWKSANMGKQRNKPKASFK